MNREDALDDVKRNMTDIMKGMTMIVGFYMRGPVGAPVSNPALEITSSVYVSHSAELLYRNAFNEFNQEVIDRGHFFTNVHSEGLNRTEDLPDARVFMDRQFQTTYSYKCTYAGNTLLLKKGNHRFAVDKAVYTGRGERAFRAYVHHRHKRARRADHLVRRGGPLGLRQDHHSHGRATSLWGMIWPRCGSPRTAASDP